MTKTKPRSRPKQKRGVPDEYRKQRQLVVRMTETEYAHLEALAERQKVPISSLVRAAIHNLQ